VAFGAGSSFSFVGQFMPLRDLCFVITVMLCLSVQDAVGFHLSLGHNPIDACKARSLLLLELGDA
jgi:hypothetical protein